MQGIGIVEVGKAVLEAGVDLIDQPFLPAELRDVPQHMALKLPDLGGCQRLAPEGPVKDGGGALPHPDTLEAYVGGLQSYDAPVARAYQAGAEPIIKPGDFQTWVFTFTACGET